MSIRCRHAVIPYLFFLFGACFWSTYPYRSELNEKYNLDMESFPCMTKYTLFWLDCTIFYKSQVCGFPVYLLNLFLTNMSKSS